jgi:hypothetical protein
MPAGQRRGLAKWLLILAVIAFDQIHIADCVTVGRQIVL